MTDEARQAKRQYEREWRRKNADKVRAINERYWANKAAENRQKQAEIGRNNDADE